MMSQCVWELLSIEKSFIKESENDEIDPIYNSSKNYEFDNLHNTDIRSEKVDYDYEEETSKHSKIKNEKNKLKFEKIMHKFFISDISKYVKAYVKKNDSNIRSEIGITSSQSTKSEEERYWVNSYIYNFISHCLMTYNDCKHYIVITSSKNLIQKLTGTGNFRTKAKGKSQIIRNAKKQKQRKKRKKQRQRKKRKKQRQQNKE